MIFIKMRLVLTRLADSDGADCPRLEFLILTRLLSTMDPAKRTERVPLVGALRSRNNKNSRLCNHWTTFGNHSPPLRLLLLLCCAAAAAMRFSESENLLPRADMAAGGRRNADEATEVAPPAPMPRASTADFLLLLAAMEAACWPYPEEPVPPSRIIRISQELMFWWGAE